MKAVVLLAPLALAACGSQGSVSADDASVTEVQAKIKQAGGTQVFLTPGRWDARMTVGNVDIPGMPAELAQRMRQAMAARTSSTCLTPEEAKKPAAEFFAGKDRKDCRYEHFEMGGGGLDARMTCGGQGGGAVISMKGNYDPTSFHMAMTMNANGMAGAPHGAMSMAMMIDSRRVGACSGKEGN